MKKLLIIDSNSIINRAFYGVRYLSAKDGTPTNAIFGFLKTLFKLIDENHPDYICAAFDLKAPTFRHKMYDAYKAQRKPMPEDLAKQMPIAKEILTKMGITILEKEGYEADDIIGTISRLCEEKEIECFIATGDKDDLQLASEKTKVILTVTKSGVNETVYYSDKEVFEKYNVTPTEFIDVKALMGDTSDNIPGVMGIGEKTALSLIEKHKNIEYIYENIDNIGLKGAMLEKLKNGKDSAFLSKTLATIDRNVPIEFDFSSCEFAGDVESLSSSEVFDILHKLNLESIIKRLNFTEEKTSKKASESDILKDAKKIIISGKAELNVLAGKISKKGECSCWFKFNMLSLSCIGIAIDNTAYFVDLDIIPNALDILSPLFSDENIKKYTFDIKDTIVSLADKVKINGIAYDCAVAAYLLNPARPSYTLEGVLEEFLGISLDIADSNAQISLFDEDNSFEEVSMSVLSIKPLMDITKKLLEENGQSSLYYDIELPLVSVLADMQLDGIKVDTEQLSLFSNKLSTRIDDLVKEIHTLAGEEFNINSPKQLGVILFEKLGLKTGKKTKTGYSTNIDVLEKLRSEHPIINLLIEYRQLAKLKSTYCDGLMNVINEKTGRIHSQFKQLVTVTGRISSTEPNMQNIPVRTELGREFRKMFISENDSSVLVDADYSQIELRVLAHISNDKTMIDAFKNNEDIHAVTASQVLGIPVAEVTSEQRSSAKAVNFGIVYGIGEYSLSQDLGISVKQAKEYIKSYLEKYSGVREYMENIKEQAKNDGYVKTVMNRIRYIPELKSTNFVTRSFGERVALNTPIQGTAADIIKLAMVKVYNRLKKENLKARLILQVHDELIVEAPKEEEEIVKKLLKEEMESTVNFAVPMIADTSSGRSWYDAK